MGLVNKLHRARDDPCLTTTTISACRSQVTRQPGDVANICTCRYFEAGGSLFLSPLQPGLIRPGLVNGVLPTPSTHKLQVMTRSELMRINEPQRGKVLPSPLLPPPIPLQTPPNIPPEVPPRALQGSSSCPLPPLSHPSPDPSKHTSRDLQAPPSPCKQASRALQAPSCPLQSLWRPLQTPLQSPSRALQGSSEPANSSAEPAGSFAGQCPRAR